MEKKTSLFGVKANNTKCEKNVKDMNIFEKENFRSAHSTLSGNGSVKLTSTGDAFVDDFGAISTYKDGRNIEDVFSTMKTLWSIDPLMTLKEMAYIRLISRDTKLWDGELLKGQKGQGLKREFIDRMLWLVINHKDTFVKNLEFFVALGSWNDLIELLREDLSYNGIANRNRDLFEIAYNYIAWGLKNEEQRDLVKKYLPQIKSSRNCTTMRNQCNNYIAKGIAVGLFGTMGDKASAYKTYRLLKTSGKAHEWQKHISRQDYGKLNFGAISGRALSKLVNSKFLENHDLESVFAAWVNSQDTVKFTGFPYELYTSLTAPNKMMRLTADKQFKGLIDWAKNNSEVNTNFIVCLDTSGSMGAIAEGTNITSLDVAKSMALYFSYLLEGKFKGTFLEFARNTVIKTWVGDTPSERLAKTCMSGYCGNTDFMSVANLFVDLKNCGYAESEFPTGVICISDGEFDRPLVERFGRTSGCNKSASVFEAFLNTLRNGGFSEDFVSNFKLVLWDIPNNYYEKKGTTFESLADAPNFFYMGGFDPSGITFLTGKTITEKNGEARTPKTARELFEAAMSQELLSKLVL